jgi:hypothetical protein
MLMKNGMISFFTVIVLLLAGVSVSAQDCPCNKCSGTGWEEVEELCNICGGSTLVTCIRCNGKGTELCTFCFESGVVSVNCGTCGGSGKVEGETCGTCSGSGKVNEKCTNCDGRGRLPCGRCGESGNEGCTMCFGTGKKIWKYPCSKCGQTGKMPCE